MELGSWGDFPLVKTATAPNNSLADIEKGPKFHMEESAAPSGPAGRNALVPRAESAEVGDPE
eukprot:15484492-Alexandrium_andersonii.AAC.1